MCKRSNAQAAQDAAADALARACTSRFPCDAIGNRATAGLIPPAPADFAELLEMIDDADRRPRSRH